VAHTRRVIGIEARRRFPVPLEHGFDYITDPTNWPSYWPDFVRLEPGGTWREPGDRSRVVVRLIGREVTLELTLLRFEPRRLVEYDSVQRGLPDARHRRLFETADGAFDYTVVVEYEPRGGVRGLVDRTLVRRAIERAARKTLDNLSRALASA
jgi:uncharacterized protein YndB with AHSA1/START domain